MFDYSNSLLICAITICKMFITGDIMSRLLILEHRWKLCHIMTFYTVCDEHRDDSNRSQKSVLFHKILNKLFYVYVSLIKEVHFFVKSKTKLCDQFYDYMKVYLFNDIYLSDCIFLFLFFLIFLILFYFIFLLRANF